MGYGKLSFLNVLCNHSFVHLEFIKDIKIKQNYHTLKRMIIIVLLLLYYYSLIVPLLALLRLTGLTGLLCRGSLKQQTYYKICEIYNNNDRRKPNQIIYKITYCLLVCLWEGIRFQLGIFSRSGLSSTMCSMTYLHYHVSTVRMGLPKVWIK